MMKAAPVSGQPQFKKAPTAYVNDEEDDDFGDIDENNDTSQKQMANYRTQQQPHREDGKRPGGGLAVDQTGSEKRDLRSNSANKKDGKGGKKGNQMGNKDVTQSSIGGEEHHPGDPEYSKDFNSAYHKLVEKIYQEQGNTLLLSQDEIYKVEHLKELNEENFRQRINEFEEKKKKKIQMKLDEKKEKETEGCTFKPVLVTQNDQKRSIDQFLEDQKKFLDKVKKKNEDLQQLTSKAQVSTQAPNIDETSRKIIEEKAERKGKPTHERLYELNKERQMKQAQKQQAEKSSQKKTQTLEKREQLDQVLYEDAQRRKEEQARKKQELDRIRDQPKEKKFKNENSEKFVLQKFDRELKQAEQELLQDEGLDHHDRRRKDEDDEGVTKYTYEQMVKILVILGFVPQNKQNDGVNEKLCKDLWSVVQGERNQGVSMDALRIMLLNVIGIRIPEREHKPDDHDPFDETLVQQVDDDIQKNEIKVERLGFFDDDTFYLRQGDHLRVYVYFKTLYINRVQFVGQQKKFSRDFQDPNKKFQEKPQISEKTSKLAMERRKKQIGADKNVSIVEILLHPKEQKEEWLKAQQEQREQQQIEGCTFKPKLTNFDSNAQRTTHGDKCLDLYARTQKGQYKEKKMKTAQDYEFERNSEQCTFAPKINDGINAEEPPVPTNQIKGVDKVMERLQKGREQQLQKKLATERGMPSQMAASLGKPEPSMNFASSTSKHKSGFGQDGSQINPKKKDFGASQTLDKGQLQKGANRQQRINQQHQRQGSNQNDTTENQNYPDQTQEDEINVTASQTINISQSQHIGPSDEIEQHIQRNTQPKTQGANFQEEENNQNIQSQEDDEDHDNNENSKQGEPMLFVDVNLGTSGNKRIVVYEGDTAESLAESFSRENGLDATMKEKLTQMLQSQIANVLEKIDEEQNSNNSDMIQND